METEIETFSPLTYKNVDDGIPLDKIRIFLEAGILFTIEEPGRYVFILDEGKVYLRSINYVET